jgi:DNA repair protein RadC
VGKESATGNSGSFTHLLISPEDVLVTQEMVQAGNLSGCEVLDHLVIGQGRFVSLRERGLGFDKP